MLTTRLRQRQRHSRQSGFCHIRTRSIHTRNVVPPNDLRADLEGRTPVPRPPLAPSPAMSLSAGEKRKKKKNKTTTKTRTHNRSVLLSFNSALISITATRRWLRSRAPRAATVYPSCHRYLPFKCSLLIWIKPSVCVYLII